MPSCQRFVPILVGGFLYALIVPIAILARMGSGGWHWIWNDPAFGFFMVAVFPFSVAVFSCIVDTELLYNSVNHVSRLNVAPVLYLIMLVVLIRGVYLDFYDEHRLRQPYMLADSSKMMEMAALHDHAFDTKDFESGHKSYENGVRNGALSKPMTRLYMISNFFNVVFGVSVFCYLFLLTLKPEKIGERTCNHLVFVISTLAVWFPCRAYADWYINLSDVSWIGTYQAAWILLILLVAGCIMLAAKMVEGTLYHRYVIVAGAISAVITGLAVFKGKLLSMAALNIAAFDPTFKVGFVLIVAALLFYLSNSVHQRA
jgi:hypothetical protein